MEVAPFMDYGVVVCMLCMRELIIIIIMVYFRQKPIEHKKQIKQRDRISTDRDSYKKAHAYNEIVVKLIICRLV